MALKDTVQHVSSILEREISSGVPPFEIANVKGLGKRFGREKRGVVIHPQLMPDQRKWLGAKISDRHLNVYGKLRTQAGVRHFV